MRTPHVLVVDDEADLCELLALRLETHGFRVTARQTLGEAMAVLAGERVDCVVLDVRLDRENGLDMVQRTRALGLDVSLVVLTADGTDEIFAGAREGGVFAVLLKPFDAAELVRTVRSAANGMRA